MRSFSDSLTHLPSHPAIRGSEVGFRFSRVGDENASALENCHGLWGLDGPQDHSFASVDFSSLDCGRECHRPGSSAALYCLLGETVAGRPLFCVAATGVEETMPQLPTTDSIQELATFWQRHDLTDFEDELEEVPGTVFHRGHVVDILLSGEEHRAVREAAASRSLDEASLIHEWVKQRLDHP